MVGKWPLNDVLIEAWTHFDFGLGGGFRLLGGRNIRRGNLLRGGQGRGMLWEIFVCGQMRLEWNWGDMGWGKGDMWLVLKMECGNSGLMRWSRCGS